MITNKKNILILTLPLRSNYGGILQAYALQQVLRRGFGRTVANVVLKNRLIENQILISFLKVILGRYSKNLETPDVTNIRYVNTRSFIAENICTVEVSLRNHFAVKRLSRKVDCIFVGSDQVWRNDYASITTFLLDFTRKWDVRRIAYAASFGKDNVDGYSSKLISKSSNLAKRFNAISTREGSGVKICKRYWDVDAIQLVDPTMLLNKSDYIKLIETDVGNTYQSKGSLFLYVLDNDKRKDKIADKIASKLNLISFEIIPAKITLRKDFFSNTARNVLPPIAQWLRSFMEAEFVVTDSFHGCVFSIIFNKPFIAIGNESRGLARFNSLLCLFKLKERLVQINDEISDEIINNDIDWKMVNKIIRKEQKRSFTFLNANINSSEDA